MEEELNSEIKKLIPKVYDDALQPSVIEIGKSIKETVKLALKPYNGIIWSIDKSFDWLTNTISQRVENYKIKKIKAPNIETTIKVIQGVQTTGALNDFVPRHLFANLLFSEINAEYGHETHPAYAELLKQFTQEECKILCVIANRPLSIYSTSTLSDNYFDYNYKEKEKIRYSNETHDLQIKCGFTETAPLSLYIDNLLRLGIIERQSTKHDEIPSSTKEEASVYHRELKLFEEYQKRYKNDSRCPKSVKIRIDIIKPTYFGQNFLGAIGASQFYDHYSNIFIKPDWIKD